MAETFGDCWRRVRLSCPDAPFGLVRNWTQHAYETLVKRRPWNFTRVHAQMLIPAARTVTVTCTLGSSTVTSAAAFLAADVGKQFRLTGGTYYTIQTFVDASTVTIDMPYASTTATAAVSILGVYQTLPADFGAFELVVDLTNQRIVPWWHTQEELGAIDPARTSSDGTPRVLVSRQLSTVPATLGQVQYEWWPAPTSASAFPYYYRKQAAILADDDPLLGVVSSRVLEIGALADCAKWPGTAEKKNPYFNMTLHKQLLDEFNHECAILELRDDDQAVQSWVTLPYHRWATWDLSFDTRYLRSTDATVGDYR